MVAPKTKPFTWSYSALKLYLECPAKYRFKHILRMPEAKSLALARGIALHDALEAYVIRKEPLSPKLAEYPPLKAVLDGIAKRKGLEGEKRWEFDRTFAKCEKEQRWGVAKLDYYYPVGKTRAVVGDYKSGKIYPDNVEQTEFYALIAFHRFPVVKNIETQLVYLDQRTIVSHEYERSDVVERVGAKFVHLVGQLEAETEWRARPNSRCKWCDFSKTKGGPCSAA